MQQFLLPSVHSVPEVAASGAVLGHPRSTAPTLADRDGTAESFRRVYLEQLAQRYYRENGGIAGLEALTGADITEMSVVREAGKGANKRYRVYFREYNVSVVIEDSGYTVTAKAV